MRFTSGPMLTLTPTWRTALRVAHTGEICHYSLMPMISKDLVYADDIDDAVNENMAIFVDLNHKLMLAIYMSFQRITHVKIPLSILFKV